jgi:hypothetical protein
MLNKPANLRGWQFYLFCDKNLRIKLNFRQKNRAEHGAVISEEKQTLLSIIREKLQSKLCQVRFYIELTLI